MPRGKGKRDSLFAELEKNKKQKKIVTPKSKGKLKNIQARTVTNLL